MIPCVGRLMVLLVFGLGSGCATACERATRDAADDALADVEACAPYGTTWRTHSVEYDECYAQVYNSTYEAYWSANCEDRGQ